MGQIYRIHLDPRMRTPEISQSWSPLTLAAMEQRGKRERRDPHNGAGETEHVVADKLDRLSSAEAELVIQRALKLSDDEKHLDDYGSLDRETLEVVATELGIPLKHLSRALAERKARTATEGDDTWFERLLRIDDLDGAALVRGNVDAVHRALVTWFTSHEGLRAVRVVANRGEWERDATPLTAIKMGLGMTNASRALRRAGTVTHEITSLSPDEHLVSIEAGKSLLLRTGTGLMVGASALSILAGIAVAAGPASLLSGILAGLWTGLLFGTGAVFIVRSWASRINRSIRRALDAITDPAASGVFDRLPGSLGNFLRGLGFGRRR